MLVPSGLFDGRVLGTVTSSLGSACITHSCLDSNTLAKTQSSGGTSIADQL